MSELIRCQYCGGYYSPNIIGHSCTPEYPNNTLQWYSPPLSLSEAKLDRIIELLEELIKRTK